MQPSDTSSTPAKRLPWQSVLKRAALELVVVFVGVYAAFMVSEYQQERAAAEHRQQIEQALIQEIEEILVRTRRAAEQTPQAVAYYDSTIAAGAMPPLQPFTEPLNVRSYVWEAALQSGGLNLLEVSTFYRISEFYNALNAGFEQLEQLRSLSERVLIPRLGEGPEAFYDPVSKQLRPEYAWYLSGLRRMADLAYGITEMGDRIVADLKEEEVNL